MTLSINHSTPADSSFTTAGAAAWDSAHSLSGTLPISSGGTGQTTAAAAITALAGTQAYGKYLRSDGTSTTLSDIQAADVPTLDQNTTGVAANVTGIVAVANGGTGTATPALIAGTNVSITGTWPNQTINSTSSGSGTVTSVAASVPAFLSIAGSPITTSGTLAISYSGTALPIANGGTSATTASGARSSLSAAQSGANTDITSIALTSGTITTAPSSSNDIVNKSYADSIVSGVNFHPACNYASVAALSPANTYNNGTSGVGATLTASSNGTLTVDSYTFVSGDVGKRILVKNEAAGANNGVYTLTQVGTASLPYILTRATDYDTSGSGTNEVDQGDLLLVLSGTTNANTSWVQQTPLPITLGTTAIAFIQFAAVQTYTAGTGLTLTTNQFSITNTGTAGTYGSASQVPVLVTNAQGQVTSVTNTAIAIDGSAVSGNITGNAANITGTVAIGNGGTGQTTASAAFNALSPVTNTGDLIIGNGTNSATRLGIGANGYILTSDGTTASWAAAGSGSGTVTSITAGTGLTGGTITSSGTIALATTAVTAGTYTSTNLTVDAYGRITAASNGSGGSGITTGKSIAMAMIFGY